MIVPIALPQESKYAQRFGFLTLLFIRKAKNHVVVGMFSVFSLAEFARDLLSFRAACWL